MRIYDLASHSSALYTDFEGRRHLAASLLTSARRVDISSVSRPFYRSYSTHTTNPPRLPTTFRSSAGSSTSVIASPTYVNYLPDNHSCRCAHAFPGPRRNQIEPLPAEAPLGRIAYR